MRNELKRTVVEVSNKKVAFKASFAFMILLCCVYLIIRPEIYNKVVFLQVVAILFALIGLLGISAALKRVINLEPELVFDTNGLFMRYGLLKNVLIPWSEINKVDVYHGPNGPDVVLLFVDKPGYYINQATKFNQFFMKMNKITYKTPVYITPIYMNMNAYEIAYSINEYIKKYRKSLHNN